MKRIILTLSFIGIFAVVGAAQFPCLVNTAKFDPTRYTPPVWSPRPADTAVYKVTAGGSWVITISMPAAGHCVGSFESYDDRDDLAVIVTDNLGHYIRKQPAGDIEILFLDATNLVARNAGRSYAAIWSSGRTFGGTYDVSLNAGNYYVVISNSHSYLAPKSVRFTIGEKQLTP